MLPPDKDIDEAVVASGKITVVCHGCGARYKVKDATVRGHRFRAICKRCGGIIVARCTNAFTVLPEQGASTGQPQSAMQLNGEELHQEDEPSWYVVIDKKPHGPMTPDQVRASYADKQIFSRSYMWRAGEPEWRHLFDCPEFKDLFYDPQTTLFHQPEDQGEDLSEEAAQFLRRRLTSETQADGPDGRKLKHVSDQRVESAPDYSQPGEEEDYLAEEPTRVPTGESEHEATAFFDTRGTQDPPGAGYQDDPMAGESFAEQPHLDPQHPDQQYADQQYADQQYADQQYADQHPDQQYPDQQYPDQQYLDQQNPADPYAQASQEQWDQEPEMGQPWAPPEPEPRRKAILPAPTGAAQRAIMSSEDNAAGDGFARPLGPGEKLAALPATPQSAQGGGPTNGAFSSAPSLSVLAHTQAPGPGAAPGTGAGTEGPATLPGGPPTAGGGLPLFGESGYGEPAGGALPGLPSPAKSVFEDGLKPIGGPVLKNSEFMIAAEEEPFWTTGKIIALAAVGGGLFVALTVVLVVSLVRPDEKIVVAKDVPRAQVPTVASENTGAKENSGSTEQGTVEKAAVKKAAVKKAEKAAVKKAAKARAKPQVVMQKVKVARSAKPRKVRRPSRRHRRPVRKKKPDVVDHDDLLGVGSPSAKTKKPSQDEVDDLLAVAPRPRTKPAPRAAPKAQSGGGGLPVQPSKASIRAAMRSVLPRIRSCHDKHQQTGTIRVSLILRGNGTADVDIVGAFAGTPTGFCVLGALERRTFPRFTGKPVKLVYPFKLQ